MFNTGGREPLAEYAPGDILRSTKFAVDNFPLCRWVGNSPCAPLKNIFPQKPQNVTMGVDRERTYVLICCYVGYRKKYMPKISAWPAGHFFKWLRRKKEGMHRIPSWVPCLGYVYLFSLSDLPMKALKRSMGSGKTMVLLFSLAISERVER